MLPIFKEYIQFLVDNGVDLKLEEGYYWLDKQIIKAYGTDGILHKIARLHIDNDLNIKYNRYKDKTGKQSKKLKLESWDDTVQRKLKRLIRLERCGKRITQLAIDKHQGQPTVLYSGGKDSSVTNDLTQQVVKSKIIFSNTSLDCADTYLHVKKIPDIQIINPDMGFYQWIDENIIPTRFSRGCCTYFKEGAMIQNLNPNDKYLFFMGMRNQESTHRSNYNSKWKNDKWGKRDWQGILPIRMWTEEDIWLYILWKGLDFNPKYRKGYSRVGCAIACPFYTKSTWVLDKYWYPKMYNRWHNILANDFVNNYKWTRLNCTLKEYHTCWNGGLLRPEPTEEVIKEFADQKGIEYQVAEKYFNHECKTCGKKVNKKDEIAMNLKLLGRNINTYYCKKDLMKYLDISKTQWDTYIAEFKQAGCELF